MLSTKRLLVIEMRKKSHLKLFSRNCFYCLFCFIFLPVKDQSHQTIPSKPLTTSFCLIFFFSKKFTDLDLICWKILLWSTAVWEINRTDNRKYFYEHLYIVEIFGNFIEILDDKVIFHGSCTTKTAYTIIVLIHYMAFCIR